MRNKIDQVSIFQTRIQAVREWKSRSRRKITATAIQRCARDLGLTTACVKDVLNAIQTTKRTQPKSGEGIA